MKRPQDSQDTPIDAPQTKKPKMAEGDENGESGGWTKVEKRKRKKATKNEAKLDNAQPLFMYSNKEIVKRNNAIGIEDIRDLCLHIIADAPVPNWLHITNTNLIQRLVVLLIPGVTPDLLSLPPLPTSATSNPNLPLSIPLPPLPTEGQTTNSVPFIAATFSHACPTRAPGDQTRMHSVLSTFFQGPISGEEKKRRMTQRLHAEILKDSPAQYLLTLEQMVENEYPIPSYMADIFQKPPGWVETPEPQKQAEASLPSKGTMGRQQTIYAIDCEMCLTEDGKELTRVCIVDYHSGIVVYDQLVKPKKPILDYLTRWSGITAEALAPVTTTHTQVQAHVLRLLSPPTPNPFSTTKSTEPAPPTPILLGHSLESDLNALKICHPLCIDTALMYHHPRGRPLKPGLAWLTKKWCGREIQSRGEGGHDPEEDARACLDLLKKKLQGGPGFGEFKIDYESIFERMARASRRAGGGGGPGSIKTCVVDHGNPHVMHGSKANTAIGCKTDADVLEGLLGAIPSHHFVFGRFMALADVLGWTTPRATPDSPPPQPGPPPSPEALSLILTTLNEQLKTLHATLPPRTAIVIFSGHSDPRKMSSLNARKAAFENALRSGKTSEELGPELKWSAGDGRDLEEAVELARRGLLFLGVKQ